MATLTFSNASVCAGGDHLSLDVSVNGGASRRVTYLVTDLRAVFSAEDREALALNVLKLHCMGRTAAQVRSEFQAGSVVVTI